MGMTIHQWELFPKIGAIPKNPIPTMQTQSCCTMHSIYGRVAGLHRQYDKLNDDASLDSNQNNCPAAVANILQS